MTIRRGARAVFVIAALMALNACSRYPYLYLLNHFGRQIEIAHATMHGDRGETLGNAWLPWTWRFLIDDGAGREILWLNGNLSWTIEVRAGRCRAWYDIPTPHDTSSGAFYVLQLEPDFSLYLIDRNAWYTAGGVSQIASSPPTQPEGFPISPTSRVCR